ncbi:MAG: hypothetical protein L3J59_06200 [Methylococcaceae bacterium]|nr:hypothetical protein [Methylococcaceae bacterium]
MTAQAEQSSELLVVNKKVVIDLITQLPRLTELLLGCLENHMLHLNKY